MKTLLKNCKHLLRTEINDIRSTDIYITEDIRLIRKNGSYPAIGIKDGGIDFAAQATDQDDDSLQVTIVAYVSLQRQEAMIIGTSRYKGVLEIAEEIITALTDQHFNDQYDSALPLSQGQSEIITDGTTAILMVPVVMQFTRLG